MQVRSVKPRTRRCRRCKRVLADIERGHFCPRCYEAVRPCCVECGESLIGEIGKTGVCYRCEPGSNYWIERHKENDDED